MTLGTKMDTKEDPKGFIVSPSSTGDNKWHASYGANHNKTVKSFGSYKDAKNYLRKKNTRYVLYKNTNFNISVVDLRKKSVKRTTKKRTNNQHGLFHLFGG